MRLPHTSTPETAQSRTSGRQLSVPDHAHVVPRKWHTRAARAAQQDHSRASDPRTRRASWTRTLYPSLATSAAAALVVMIPFRS